MTDVLAIAEHRNGDLRDVSLELVSAGRGLAEEIDGDLHVAVISGDVNTFANSLNLEGVETIHTVTYGKEFNHDVYTQAVAQLFDELRPRYLLMPNSVNGLDYAPAIATRLNLPLVTDVIELRCDSETLIATREMYGGKVKTTTEIDSDGVAVTIRSAEWPPAEVAGSATIDLFDVEVDESEINSTVTGYEEIAGGDIDITEADILVSVGRGIKEEENLTLIHDLADAMGATVSSSRPIVDNGWLPANHQVGQSGKVVTPDIYIAIGISGAVQHVAGMKGSDTIVAINTDPTAPIMDIADYAIHDDLFDVVPALTEQFQ